MNLSKFSTAFVALMTFSIVKIAAQTPVKLDTVTKLSQMKSDSAIWKHHGKYTLVVIDDSDDEDPAPQLDVISGTCSPIFAGKARSAAKLSFAAAPYQTYATMTDFQATLKTDAFMRTPAIGLTSNSPRVALEKRNVSITAAFLYGISLEGDDDFHLIVGDKSGKNFFNCEISGLPPKTASSYATLKATRDYITKSLGSDFCGKTGYTIFKPAIPITIKGSLFYDIDHSPGSVGPAAFRPPTSWEIHPINAIHF
jgi:hypothetical protein